MDRAAGETPEEEAVDRARGELCPLGPRPRAGHMIEDPGELGAREIGIEQQSSLRLHQGFDPVGTQVCAYVGGAPVLPDDQLTAESLAFDIMLLSQASR
jgi:hypothetical protein